MKRARLLAAVLAVAGCVGKVALLGLALAGSGAAVAQQRAQDEPAAVAAARYNAQLAIAYLKTGDLVTAREKIERALQQNPRDASVHTTAGLVFERVGEERLADRHYARAVALEPRNPDNQNNYAVFQCRRGQFAKGQRLFEQAARNPVYRTPEVAFTNAGVCARSAKDPAKAEALFRQALAVRPTFPDALLQMADLALERGNGLQGRAFMQRYFANAPATPDSLWLAIRIERALGDARAAEEYAVKLQGEFPTSEQARQLNGAMAGA
jgi:type IV pilus assembly protein PilF